MAASLFASLANAQEYPSRPIRLVVPYSAGGPSDSQARMIGQKLSDMMKQPVIVENRPGGAGNIGADLVAKAKPDGYTLLFCSTGALVVNPHIFGKMPFNALTDFAPIALVSSAPTVLAVHPGVPAANIGELIRLIKADPDKFSYASGGEGTTQHLSGELLKGMAGLKMAHIPYKGEGQSTTDALGGHVPIIFNSVGTGLPNYQAGKLRPLAVTSAQRNPALPDVPTLAESGLSGYEVTAWQGVLAPAGTPLAIIGKLNAAIGNIIKSPEITEKLTSVGNVPAEGTAEEFATFIRTEMPRWGKLVRQAGIKLDS
ncbi:MAG: Bug family tripartite tricarboxylate transporter substrate binding protein [Noviherbaspirillum sp.]